MTDLEFVEQQLDAIKTCALSDVHAHLSPALGRFRFIPRAERRECADAFVQWADAQAMDTPVKHAYAVFVQSIDRFINEEHEASLRLVTRSRAAFVEHDDHEGLGLCGMLIGAIYRTFGNYDLALTMLWEGFELLKASGQYPVFLAANANSMANINFDLGHLDEALAMFTVTYEESARADDFYFMVYALHGVGRVYMRQDKRADAESVLQRALALAEQHRHPLQISNSLTELATLQFAAGQLDQAEALSARALAIREQHRLLGGAVTNCVRLGEIYGKRAHWTEALAVLTRALAIAEEVKVKPKIAQVHQLLSDVYEHTGDHAKSLVHYKRYHELREQVEREDSVRKLADAKLIFEAEQTKKENAVIKAQKQEIEQKNRELQDTIDELTRAKISRKARAMILALVIVLFVFQDAILGTALRLLASDNYFVLLAVKMAIIFSLNPLNQAIERYLLKRMSKEGGERVLRRPASGGTLSNPYKPNEA